MLLWTSETHEKKVTLKTQKYIYTDTNKAIYKTFNAVLRQKSMNSP